MPVCHPGKFHRNIQSQSGADQGLFEGGRANPLGAPTQFLHYLKNPMKLKKFWSVGGGARRERLP